MMNMLLKRLWNKKIQTKILIFGLLGVSIFGVPVYGYDVKNKAGKGARPALSTSFTYNNQRISNGCMSELLSSALFGILYPSIASLEEPNIVDISECMTAAKKIPKEEEGDEFNWFHVGSLGNGMQIVYGYLWPQGAMAKFSGLFVVKQEGYKLSVVSEIAGGTRHSSMVSRDGWTLNKNKLTFRQGMPLSYFVNFILEERPELTHLFEHKTMDGLCEGEACYFGVATLRVRIMPDGKPAPIKLVNFTLALSFDEQRGKEYCQSMRNNSPKPASLNLSDALHYVSGKLQCQNMTTLNLSQLSTMMKEVAYYTS